jgi:hypothetical protein
MNPCKLILNRQVFHGRQPDYFKYFINLYLNNSGYVPCLLLINSAFSADVKIIIILVYTCVGISVTKYFGHTTDFLDYVLINPSKFDWWYCSFFFGSDNLSDIHPVKGNSYSVT